MKRIAISSLVFLLSLSLSLHGSFSLEGEKVSSPPKDTLPKQLDFKKIPFGLDPIPVPESNPLTQQKIDLGRKLFFDPILSGDNTISCATCHLPDHGFASVEGQSAGINSQKLDRRAPSLINRAYGKAMFWDGRTETLEKQALEPIANPKEMGSTVADAIRRLEANKDYKAAFETTFADGITPENLGKAIASFERVLLRGDAPVDRFRARGQREGMSAAERHGLWLYESKGQCWRCHGGTNFTDDSFRNTGVSWGKTGDLGRSTITAKEEDKGKFKTPTLRGVGLTAPYMHDGSIKTLKEVVEFYNRGGNPNPNLDPILKPLQLTPDEIDDLVAFLKSL